MALASAVISMNLKDLVGDTFDARRVKVYASTNIPTDTVIDTAGNEIRLGTGSSTIDASGSGTLTVLVPGAGSNPASWQTYVHVDYPDKARQARVQRTFGPFTITADANLADLISEQEVPPDYLSQVAGALGEYVDDAQAARDEAQAARDAAVDVSNIATPDALVKTLVQTPTSATAVALSASYVGSGTAVFVAAVPNRNGGNSQAVADANFAALMAAHDKALADGGIVDVGAGTIYIGNHSLPLTPGVKWRCVEPSITQVVPGGAAYAGDFTFDFTDGTGTVFKGDGTAPCFTDSATDQATLPANLQATATNGSGIIGGVGIDGFTRGVSCGAKNSVGLVYSELGRIYARNCSDWGVYLKNFQHTTIDHVAVCLSQRMGYLGSDIAPFVPGNSKLGELYGILPNDGRDLRKCRGWVLDAKQGDGQNELLIQRLQVNGYNVPTLTFAGTFTAGSPNITVPDGTKFLAGMLVHVGDNGVGLWPDRTLVVKTIVGNTLTLAFSANSSAIVVDTTGTVPGMTTTGFANIEITAAQVSSYNTAVSILQIDSEGSRVGMYAENLLGGELHLHQMPSEEHYGLVARNCGFVNFYSSTNLVTDFDSNTAVSCTFKGSRGATKWKLGKGMWWDTVVEKFYFSGQADGPAARPGSAVTAAQLEQLLFDIGLFK